jgi:phosphotransferase system enzyme I (PtsP)
MARTTNQSNVDLIWTVSELSGLFEKRTNMGGFLQDVVEMISSHMESDVCSIYLYDEEADALVLRATKGLKADSVGAVQLNLGEGITGQALKELRPIREARAKKSPHFKLVPEVDEESYESFLAVPIKRGLNRIGVMVLQDRKPDYFDTQDTRALQAIASHLAATLENVEILMEIHGSTARREDREAGEVSVVHGRSAAPGVARGVSVSFGQRTQQLTLAELADDESPEASRDGEGAMERFRSALDATQEQLEALQHQIGEDLSDVASLIFSSHLLMLKDEQFSSHITEQIESGTAPEQAVTRVINEYVELFSQSSNARTREKTQDIKDLGHRLLRNLQGHDDDTGDYRGQIVIAAELFPSELVKVALQDVEGLVLQDGGLTAHISILARSLGVPVVLTRDERVYNVPDETEMILDADHGTVYINPDENVRSTFEANRGAAEEADRSVAEIPDESYTACGTRVSVLANINIVQDVRLALEYKAEGIGLYRSEFPFIVRNDFPTEDEQYDIYRRVISSMGEREVVLRTLDIGGDKVLPQPRLEEQNPFLGFRGIRFSLSNVDIFKEQLRAMLRAGHNADLHILLPMISAVDEVVQAREILERCKEELAAEGLDYNEKPKLGAMIELPSAVEAISALSSTADFLSIGTNDLVMYLLAVDRANDHVGHMYKHYHPAVLGALHRIVANAKAPEERLSICGDAASDPVMCEFLLGIGLRRFSVEPRALPKMKERVGSLRIDECKAVAETLLRMTSISEIEEYLGVSEETGPS